MNTEIKVGLTVWVLRPSYMRSTRELEECIVSKVGREYFYAHEKEWSPDRAQKFHLDSLMSYVAPNDNGAYRSRVYLHPDEREKEVEEAKTMESVRSFFADYGWKRKLTVDQARRILSIINESKP
jgi:hypothetical protein